MTTEDRPYHLVVDCVSGQVIYTQMTEEEAAEAVEQARERQAQQAAAEAERAQLAAMVEAHPDALVRLLAQRLGLVQEGAPS